VNRAERLVDLRETYRQRLAGDRSPASEVLDLVFQNPVLTTTRIAQSLDTSLQSALNHVRRLESEGLVAEVPGTRGRSKRGISREIYDVLEPDAPPTFSDKDAP